jgi:argininosuccinate lyase
MVRELLLQGRDFDALSIADWRAYSELFGDDVREATSAAASVRLKRTPQSTRPDAVRAALAETRQWLAGRA